MSGVRSLSLETIDFLCVFFFNHILDTLNNNILFFRLILALQTETHAQMELLAWLYSKADSNANVCQDGKDSFAKSTQTIVLKNLVF